MTTKMFVFRLILSIGFCFVHCKAIRSDLNYRGASLDANCHNELNVALKRENEVLRKLQQCTEDKCNLDESKNCEQCTQHGYTFDTELGMCYKVYATPTVCREAIKTCANTNGRLATLNTQAKVTFFTDYMKQHHPGVDGLLAGGHYDQRDGVWRWENGSKIGHLNWGKTQPDVKDQCIGMYKSDGYKWHDFGHGHKVAFLCELQ